MSGVGGRDRVRGGEGGKREGGGGVQYQHMAEHEHVHFFSIICFIWLVCYKHTFHVYTYLPFASELILQN